MSNLDMIRRGLAQEVAFIAPRWPMMVTTLRATLRVEIDSATMDKLIEECRPMHMWRQTSTDFNEPIQVDGVDVYEVRGRIPAPGWRIINPLAQGMRG